MNGRESVEEKKSKRKQRESVRKIRRDIEKEKTENKKSIG